MSAFPEATNLDLAVEAQDELASMYIHAFLEFDGLVDPVRFARAVQLLSRRAPVLACRFDPGAVASTWQWAPDDCLARSFTFQDLRDAPDPAAAADAALAALVADDAPCTEPPLLRVLLVRAPAGDRALLKLSHLVADGGGIKELLYLLAEAYRALGCDPGWDPGPAALGARTIRDVMGVVAPRHWPGVVARMVAEDRQMFDRRSPVQVVAEDRDRPAYVTVVLERELLAPLKAWARTRGATVNDLLCAGFVRAVRRLDEVTGERFLITYTVDLRRYLPPEPVIVGNISSLALLELPGRPAGHFADTLDQVRAETTRVKAFYPGISTQLRASIGGVLFPGGLRERFMRWLFRRAAERRWMGPAFTNMGRIDEARVDFGAPRLEQASLAAPIARPGTFICSATGYAGSVTLHLGCRDGGAANGRVARLARRWRAELVAAQERLSTAGG